jgi:hypothetical protein
MIEAIHDVLKNEPTEGVLPCGRSGVNAAWLRLTVLTHNVMTALKRMALPEEYSASFIMPPRRLRIAGTRWRDWVHLMPLPAG